MLRNLFHTRLLTLIILGTACQNQSGSIGDKELWIYTSLYKDTIADITPELEKDFPNVKFQFYQAGSEEIAAKVVAEELAGGIKADILIFSDRFWFEDAAKRQKLLAYDIPLSSEIPQDLRHPQHFYHAVSLPVMVLAYNQEAVDGKDAPKSFKDLMDPRWKGKIATGSPLASGTNFTTYAMLQFHYGDEFLKALRSNEVISEGGNSAVISRLQSKERTVGWVLLENLLRLKGKDDRIQTVFPQDGVVTQANVLAITANTSNPELAKEFTNWMFGEKGQKAMVKSYMYSPLLGHSAPEGAPDLQELLKRSFPWNEKFLETVTRDRESIKEKFTEMMYQ